MRLGSLLLVALLFLPAFARAQATSLKGRFVDPTNGQPVAGVQVRLTSLADTADVRKLTAKDDGTFEVPGLTGERYRLEASRLGYATLRLEIPVDRQGQDAGVLQMTPEAVDVAGVTVTESPAPAIQKGDTTEFPAGAVKISRDANAEDLVQKLPGVTLEAGKIKAHGEDVQQVLVNGKPIFGGDPAAAMRNLPAEVVDRIQVYDKGSDMADFSGFDDGRSLKTLNFILREEKGQFGKVYGGYGDRERYQGGGHATFLRGSTRLTLIGLSNNINQRNFSQQDLLGALGGGKASGDAAAKQLKKLSGGFDPSAFLVSQQGGINTTHSGGVNYVGQWGPRLSLTTSLFANDIDNDDQQSLAREYVPPQDSLAFFSQNTGLNSRNGNQRFDGRFLWTPDSVTALTVKPRIYLQNSRGGYLGLATNSSPSGAILNSSTSDTHTHADAGNGSAEITLQHRFATPGRNASAEVEVVHNARDGARAQRSLDLFEQPGQSTADTLDQRIAANSVTSSVLPRFAFTQSLSKHWQMQLSYEPQFTRSQSDARGLGLDPSRRYTVLDSLLSNTFTSRHDVQNGGVAVQLVSGAWRWQTNAAWQRTRLESEQSFPESRRVDHAFVDLLPSSKLTATFGKRLNLKLAWRTSTGPPSAEQLQNVVDNSNPLSLTAGNPDLRQAYTHNVSLRLSEADALRGSSAFLFLNLSRTAHPISNSTFTAPRDTVLDGIALARGTQLTRPVNLDAAWNASTNVVYSRPATILKSIASVNAGGSFNQTPTRLNAGTLVSRTYALRYGAVLASNISSSFDFTLSYQGSYNLARNALSTRNDGDYYAHTLGLRLSALAKSGIVIREEVAHNLQSGVATPYGQHVLLWNTTLGKKFLRNESGELRVTATDLLQQDQSVGRSLTESYVQDSRDRTLGRFVQAVFTYTFR